MPRTALVTGASGLLGRQVVKVFERAGWTVVGTALTRAKPPSILGVDLTNKVEIDDTLDQVKPQVVVHCAAQRFPDKVDADPSAAKTLNIAASQALADSTSRRGIFLIYISTDYVFAGKPGEAPYEADAAAAPTNLYGETKLEGERAVLATTSETRLAVALRVPVLYGPATEPRESAVNTLVDAVWKSQPASQDTDENKAGLAMDDWAIRYPTNTEDVARVCRDIADTYTAAGGAGRRALLPPILQFSSEDRYTKYEMCAVFADLLGLPLAGMRAVKEGNDPAAPVQRPYDCHLSTKALRQVGISVETQSFVDWWRRELGAYKH